MSPQTKKPNDDLRNPYDDAYREEGDFFNRPDMQALNDQLDAVKRDDDNETNADQAPTRRQLRREEEAQARRDAERKEWDAAENQFGYRKPGDQQPTQPRSGFKNLLNKKNALRGGVAGGTIGIVLTLFGFLAPFKIPSIMQAITDEAGQRVEQITVHRAKVILARAILSKFGVSKSIVITGDGPVASLIATLRTNNFEKNVLNKKGLFIEETANGVRLKMNGTDMGVFKNPEAIVEALDANKLTNKMINDLVKEEIPSWRWMKRAKFAKWLRIRYDVKRFGIAKSEEKDKEAKVKEMQQTRLEESYARSTENATEALNCLSDGPNCPITDKQNGQDTRINGGDASKNEVTDAYAQAGKDAAAEAGDAAAKGLTTATETAGKKLTGRALTKAIPIVNIIDTVATINHMANVVYNAADDDVIMKVPAYFRAQSYAQLYGDWAGYSDQIKDGSMDPDFIGVLATQMDGAETSRAYNCIGENKGPGNILTSLSSTAYAATDSSNCETAGVPIDNRVDENNPSRLKQAIDKTNDAIGFDAPKVLQYRPGNLVLEGWYYLSGKVTDTILGGVLFQYKLELGVLNSITSAITGVDANKAMNEWINSVIEKMMGSVFSFLGLSADPLSVGAALVNYTHAGATVSMNSFCESIGCRKLTSSQTSAQNRSIAQERAENIAQKGWLYATFSPEATHSLTNELAAALPTSLTPQRFNVSEGTTALASIIASTPSKLLGQINAPAKAESGYVDLYGVTPFGATSDDLDSPIAEQAISGEECPEVAAGEYNGCSIDKNVADSMACNFDSENSKCNFTTSAGANGQLSVMTYNILGAGHSDGSFNYKDRLKNVLDTVNDKSPDIVAFQEVNSSQGGYQQTELEQGLADQYDSYPLKDQGQDAEKRPIFWKKDSFTLEDKGTYGVPRYNLSEDEQMPWVKLKHTISGKTLYVFNLHTAAGDKDHPRNKGGLTSPAVRTEETKDQLAAIKAHVTDDSPVITTGDYNSTCQAGHNDEPVEIDGIPCTILRKAGFEDAGESAQQLGLPTQNYDYNTTSGAVGKQVKNGRHIDHVFFSQGTTVGSWENIINDTTKDASDHTPVLVGLNVPGLFASSDAPAGAVTASGFAWPLGEDNWKKHRASFLTSHYSGGGFLGSSYSNSVDISWGSAKGTSVYAMLGGTVTTQPLGRASHQCHGTPDGNNNGGMIITSKLNGHTIEIAYAHGDNVKVKKGATVQAGQQIMDLGNVGNSCGAHLHMNVSVDNKNICPQDLFVAMDKGGTLDLLELAKKATSTCAGRG